jgi:hypothetical protein
MVEELPVSNGKQPGLKLAGAAPCVEFLIRNQECLLRQVISSAVIAPNQAPQKTADGQLVLFHQLCKGGGIIGAGHTRGQLPV